jgi:hypothetical protein
MYVSGARFVELRTSASPYAALPIAAAWHAKLRAPCAHSLPTTADVNAEAQPGTPLEDSEDHLAAAGAMAAAGGKPSKKAKKGDAAAGGEKAPRKMSAHTVFLTYATKCVPQAWLDKMKEHIPSKRGVVMNLVMAYKTSLSAKVFDQFKADIEPIVEKVNADTARVKGDSHKLVELLKKRDADAGVEVHPAFKGYGVRRPSACLAVLGANRAIATALSLHCQGLLCARARGRTLLSCGIVPGKRDCALRGCQCCWHRAIGISSSVQQSTHRGHQQRSAFAEVHRDRGQGDAAAGGCQGRGSCRHRCARHRAYCHRCCQSVKGRCCRRGGSGSAACGRKEGQGSVCQESCGCAGSSGQGCCKACRRKQR